MFYRSASAQKPEHTQKYLDDAELSSKEHTEIVEKAAYTPKPKVVKQERMATRSEHLLQHPSSGLTFARTILPTAA